MVMIHAENDHCIHFLTKQLSASGDTSLTQYPKMAPMPVEREATHRAITLGEIVDVPILLVHVSAREALEQIKWGRDRGLKVYGETCPQYLFLTSDHIAQPGWEGAKYLCAPPPREKGNADALWHGLASGLFQVLSSDHCSFKFESATGKKAHGPHPHFRKVAPGVPGIETRLPLIFSEGVGKGRIDLSGAIKNDASSTYNLKATLTDFDPLSLTSLMIAPPAKSTAATGGGSNKGSSKRKPGNVLRLSLMNAPVPSTASTHWAVRVAIPDRWQIRFNAVRSTVSRPRVGPVSTRAGSPGTAFEPSSASDSTSTSGR